eukprot:1606944-Rhodomonas_salina.2
MILSTLRYDAADNTLCCYQERFSATASMPTQVRNQMRKPRAPHTLYQNCAVIQLIPRAPPVWYYAVSGTELLYCTTRRGVGASGVPR